MIGVMDKWMVQDMMLPFLEKVPAREPGVLMAMLGIFHEVGARPPCYSYGAAFPALTLLYHKAFVSSAGVNTS
jgi:hypothetical protein